MRPVLDFLKRFFSRPEEPEAGSLVEEAWRAELAGPEKGRFRAESTADYTAGYRHGGLELRLARQNLFAWTEAERYRYADFVLEGEIELPGPYSAAGFLFRYADKDNFYTILVSNRGYLRLDAVFNGKPRPIIGWTECPSGTRGRPQEAEPRPAQAPRSSLSLLVIARGSRLTILIDGLWAAEAEDDTHRAGYIAFAAQTYGEGSFPADGARFRLASAFLESRPVEVEAWYYRAAALEPPEGDVRRRLAETYFSQGNYLAAAVQLRRLEKRRKLSAEELFLKAEISLRLELHDEAEAALNACLSLRPDHPEAVVEKANLLYLRARYPELRELALTMLEREPENALAWTLAGHAHFNLGDYQRAAEAYGRAADLAPGQPIPRMNEARAWEQTGDRKAAIAAYLAAARGFYEAEAEDDLELALARLTALRAPGEELKALRAKALFRSGKKAEARKLLGALTAKGTKDSAIHYLDGLLAAERGERELALTRFERALELEPGTPLYAFRRAESLYLLGRPEAKEAVDAALALAPEDGWILNLGGLLLLVGLRQAQDIGEPWDEAAARLARDRFEAAIRALPGEFAPALNLAELTALEGRNEEALALLGGFPETAAARNLAGTILVQAARREADAEAAEALLEKAVREYLRATALAPAEAEYQENLAALYLELERYSDAEERIRRALDAGGGPRAYLLAGNLALVYGETARAEAAYRLGREEHPKDPSLPLALGRLYLSLRRYEKAAEVAQGLEGLDPRRAARLEGELLEASTEALSCAACNRAWRVPRDIPPQSGANIRAMPPDDSPAGACPRCGKIYCIACRKEELVESRFTCPDCGDFLKLSDPRLRWLVREALRRTEEASSL